MGKEKKTKKKRMIIESQFNLEFEIVTYLYKYLMHLLEVTI